MRVTRCAGGNHSVSRDVGDLIIVRLEDAKRCDVFFGSIFPNCNDGQLLLLTILTEEYLFRSDSQFRQRRGLLRNRLRSGSNPLRQQAMLPTVFFEPTPTFVLLNHQRLFNHQALARRVGIDSIQQCGVVGFKVVPE